MPLQPSKAMHARRGCISQIHIDTGGNFWLENEFKFEVPHSTGNQQGNQEFD